MARKFIGKPQKTYGGNTVDTPASYNCVWKKTTKALLGPQHSSAWADECSVPSAKNDIVIQLLKDSIDAWVIRTGTGSRKIMALIATKTEAFEKAAKFSGVASHVDDGQVDKVKAAGRSWLEFVAHPMRKTGMTSTLLGTALGLVGMAAVEERKAEAGLMVSGSNVSDYVARGAANVVKNGGDAVYMKSNFMYNGSPFETIASGGAFNRNGNGFVLGALHYEYYHRTYGGTLTIGTGSSVTTDPGVQYNVDQIFATRSYPGPVIWQSDADFVIYKVNGGIARGSNVEARRRPDTEWAVYRDRYYPGSDWRSSFLDRV